MIFFFEIIYNVIYFIYVHDIKKKVKKVRW